RANGLGYSGLPGVAVSFVTFAEHGVAHHPRRAHRRRTNGVVRGGLTEPRAAWSSHVASAVVGQTGPVAAVTCLAGRYRLADRLGVGGMAVVWRAYDEVLDRFVTVKVLAPGLAVDAAARARVQA